MEYLFDTHLLIWALEDSDKLPNSVREILLSQDATICYSTISAWEVAIKYGLNKFPISGTEFLHYCEQAGFRKLTLDDKHIIALETLQKKENTPEHNDPFDRVLLAQAKGDGMIFVTHDRKFSYYNEQNVLVM